MPNETCWDYSAAVSIMGNVHRCFDEHRSGPVGTLDMNGSDSSARRETVRIFLLRVLLPLTIVGASVITLIVLHLDGTLRDFLDRQSMSGMIAVVLILNIVGFSFIYMLIMVWQTVRHDLLRCRDP
jgi:hypothetical protein